MSPSSSSSILESSMPRATAFGVDAHGQARAERREQGFRRIGRRVVAEELRRLVDHVRRQRADEIELAEARLRQRTALHGPDLGRVGPALLAEGGEASLVDGVERLSAGHVAVSCRVEGFGA